MANKTPAKEINIPMKNKGVNFSLKKIQAAIGENKGIVPTIIPDKIASTLSIPSFSTMK